MSMLIFSCLSYSLQRPGRGARRRDLEDCWSVDIHIWTYGTGIECSFGFIKFGIDLPFQLQFLFGPQGACTELFWRHATRPAEGVAAATLNVLEATICLPSCSFSTNQQPTESCGAKCDFEVQAVGSGALLPAEVPHFPLHPSKPRTPPPPPRISLLGFQCTA